MESRVRAVELRKTVTSGTLEKEALVECNLDKLFKDHCGRWKEERGLYFVYVERKVKSLQDWISVVPEVILMNWDLQDVKTQSRV